MREAGEEIRGFFVIYDKFSVGKGRVQLADSVEVNEQGHLLIGGVDAVKLAEEYGTPLIASTSRKSKSRFADSNRLLRMPASNTWFRMPARLFPRLRCIS